MLSRQLTEHMLKCTNVAQKAFWDEVNFAKNRMFVSSSFCVINLWNRGRTLYSPCIYVTRFHAQKHRGCPKQGSCLCQCSLNWFCSHGDGSSLSLNKVCHTSVSDSISSPYCTLMVQQTSAASEPSFIKTLITHHYTFLLITKHMHTSIVNVYDTRHNCKNDPHRCLRQAMKIRHQIWTAYALPVCEY